MEEKYTKEESKTIKIGMYVGAVLFALMTYFATSKARIEQKGYGGYYPLKASFGRTDGLLVGDKVRLAGMDIGRVTNARFDNKFHAILTLEISDKVKIPDDSSASIVSSGIMGPKYIEIEPGGSEDFLPADGEFSYTQDAMVLEELLDRMISIGKANRSKNFNKKMNEFEQNVDL